ncbi:MAG: V-type ATP synthase subunit D [Anaerolineae bacterium]
MARLKISPTRSNLLIVKQRLALAREGYRLLDKKRDVLIMEILRLIQDADSAQTEVERQFRKAYATIQEARATMGTERVRRIALMRPQEVDVRVTPRSIMGVLVPTVSFQTPVLRVPYGFGDTSVVLDQARLEWAQVLELMERLSQTVTTVWRLALELRRTQRRVKALENIFIPSYEETLTFIQETLEEKDREDLFRLKLIKSRSDTNGG